MVQGLSNMHAKDEEIEGRPEVQPYIIAMSEN